MCYFWTNPVMGLEKDINQYKFRNLRQKSMINLIYTYNWVVYRMKALMDKHGLTTQQYNILRILRGAEDPLACGEISERMVRRDPDLTRLLDRMETRGLVARERGIADRRVVLSRITDEGKALLASLDEPVDAALEQALAHVPKKRLELLLELLEEVRG